MSYTGVGLHKESDTKRNHTLEKKVHVFINTTLMNEILDGSTQKET